jgi:catechol 2,3-dioxygenase-like lactoylglutathione lyase family enzyme
MPARFNHLIIITPDPEGSAAFYRDLLEATPAPSWGPFTNIQIDDHGLIQFADAPVAPTAIHLAFLVDDDLFARAVERLDRDEIAYWADPQQTRPGETNTEHGGRGVYLVDPTGNMLELTTQPYV